MKIELARLTLTNFKGVQSLDIDLSGQSAVISGDNGTGKTTIFDAWLWLLFDMDSRGNKGAEVAKTTSGAGYIHHLSHEVCAEIFIDDKIINLKKVLEENWIKPRGKADQEFSGNVAKYWVDDVPRQLKDYSAFINSLIPADLFKIISDPMYFSTGLGWRDRLNMLVEISGGISEEEIVAGDKDLESLLVKMGDKTLTDYRTMVQERIRRLNSEIQGIPARIDEIQRMIPLDQDYTSLEAEVASAKEMLSGIESSELSIAESIRPYMEMQDQIFRLKRERTEMINRIVDEENEGRNALSLNIKELVSELHELKLQKSQNLDSISERTDNIQRLTRSNETLRCAFTEAQSEIRKRGSDQFNHAPDDESCPTCGQSLPAETISAGVEKLREAFEAARVKDIAFLEDNLRKITETGKLNKQQIDGHQDQITSFLKQNSEIDVSITDHEERLALLRDANANTPIYLPAMAEKDPRIADIDDKILNLELKIMQKPEDKAADYRLKKVELRKRIDDLNRELNAKAVAEQMRSRIVELEKEMKTAASTKTSLEGEIYQCERFVRARTEKLEGKINGLFEKVGFKLFSEQINGGLSETCEAIVNNTTFSKANTAGQINAGMDIIRTISRYRGIYVPVFVDHLESINDLLQLPTQVIGLVVGTEEALNIQISHKKEVA